VAARNSELYSPFSRKDLLAVTPDAAAEIQAIAMPLPVRSGKVQFAGKFARVGHWTAAE